MKIVLYTHSDCKDVCIPFFGQLNKFMKDFEKVIFTNAIFDGIPNDYTVITYDNSCSYKDRIISCLKKINNGAILFIHEDMILYNMPDFDVLSEFEGLVLDKQADFIKLIKAGNFSADSLHKNLVRPPLDNLFSIQPTICLKENLEKIFSTVNANTIYEIERIISGVCIRLGLDKCYMASCDEENKRGTMHWDSKIFPYIATAVVKGRWNYLEYSNELENILQEYGIDKNKRGLFN